ncbi:hypothetical protein K6T82_11515 [Flavobacterium sp. 17A]|uniref:Uncharacterized protein n=1 Tax=Flavobacterium potami TaxID=2872310 RepID=A0A9X1HBJ6_9FLAO|nr:hypothetical protein [Flavobacterium potami]MBZ4035397.1 hypothetical protein [Flavobacterium potami]
MIKRIFTTLIIVLVLYCFYKPFVIQLKSYETFGSFNLKKGSVFKLKDYIKTDKTGQYNIYLVLENEELNNLNIDIPKWKVLKCEDKQVIFDLFNSELKCTGSDVSTIESKIYVYSENKLIFESEIVLDTNSIGLQNRESGWTKPVNDKEFINIFSQFKRYNLPVLIIY